MAGFSNEDATRAYDLLMGTLKRFYSICLRYVTTSIGSHFSKARDLAIALQVETIPKFAKIIEEDNLYIYSPQGLIGAVQLTLVNMLQSVPGAVDSFEQRDVLLDAKELLELTRPLPSEYTIPEKLPW